MDDTKTITEMSLVQFLLLCGSLGAERRYPFAFSPSGPLEIFILHFFHLDNYIKYSYIYTAQPYFI